LRRRSSTKPRPWLVLSAGVWVSSCREKAVQRRTGGEYWLLPADANTSLKMSQVVLSIACPDFESPNVSHVGASSYCFAANCMKVSQHGILSADAGLRHAAKLAQLVTLRSAKLQEGCKDAKYIRHCTLTSLNQEAASTIGSPASQTGHRYFSLQC
jgi:hypothetical protein